MTPAQRKKPNGTGRFGRNEAGIAAVEFALIAPILLVLYLGATDLTQALAIDRKLGTFASTVSDLVAQGDKINDTQVAGLANAGIAIMRPFAVDKTDLRLTVFDLTEDTPSIACAWPSTDAGTDIGALSTDMLALAKGRFLILATARYTYEPMFYNVFNTSMPLEQRSFHVARQDVAEVDCNAGVSTSSPTPAPDADDDTGATPPADETEDETGDDEGGSSGSGGSGTGSGGGSSGGWGGGWCGRWSWFC